MPDITKIKIGNERERSYKDFPANREFKKRAEDDNPGGGGWPADLPKPSVGGYGYTEQGEQTVIVNESVITIKGEVVSYATGVFVEPALLEVGSNYTVIFNDSEYVVTGEDFGGGASVGAKVTADGADFSVYPFAVIYSEGAPVILVTQSAGTYTVTISESSETVHKIDEKYLPEAAPDPIVENAKQTGGFGYTEHGEQTVITWDGDTEGRVNLVVGDATSYLVSDTFVTIDELDGATITFGGSTIQISRNNIMSVGDNFHSTGEGIISAKAGTYDGLVVPTDGVYFAKLDDELPFVTSLTYGTPDTIHKIDEKYLPEGGFGYTEQGEQVLYDGNLPIESPTGDGAFYSTTEIDTLEVGEIYKVIWNGDEYVCDCVESDGDVYLGNGSILGFPITTDYPFVFIEIKGSVDVMTSTAGIYSIKVSKIGDTIHKIDEKYLPVIPAAPSNDGVYALACTVTDGEPAYSWLLTRYN